MFRVTRRWLVQRRIVEDPRAQRRRTSNRRRGRRRHECPHRRVRRTRQDAK